ncbi:UDP-N-acetylglucosamine--N-acetylmuramyl-(pentapeptide) pyrophosphoryl-undecaprenol N-acetylglucosamine transferase [Desulfitobacterium hafniense]|uniref:UDP-N-acetylglucosamine--N-acetylmuramyl-(pentapeptide) pyrophosphoryl-undecaprenol N-acetylglucosamine transferase n=1 Tax=Desulfitobacterium hafniense TaxID=49338 RepID=A0A098B3U2_DESHA|nr:undecaprenyldiphospho-muramoylpentapeptide beta-N-acetylglucosaminyltransferase [Desulfitobacterium hafniense]CDX03027.1 UDP-N-acetylglucosamine--N-acetylmuramyl-(pentapeptide) pyrophosphoryl-undecaprenol N-acetylglucosamine transferase [Desulfitobacterium hafniense]
MRVIVTGGGTGGHIYPALAIAKGILVHQPDAEILYIGTREGMEARLVPEAGLEFAGVSGQGLPRKLSLETLKVGGKSFKALWETKQILKKFKPDLVVGTGGYVAGPVVLTAALFGIPTLLHEQNALPGITNKILTRFVRKVMVTFPESIAHFGVRRKLVLTGLPVRPEIGNISREKGAACLGLRPDCLTLLVTGGSRGARSINQAMPTVLKHLAGRKDIQVIWATGKATYQETLESLKTQGIQWQRENWRVLEYLKDMPEAMACADLFVGRAGATTLAEIMVAGKPGLLVPYPLAAENHQEFNARALEKDGAACVILDKDLTGENLWALVQGLIEKPEKLRKMAQAARSLGQPDALNKIVKVCLDTAWK